MMKQVEDRDPIEVAQGMKRVVDRQLVGEWVELEIAISMATWVRPLLAVRKDWSALQCLPIEVNVSLQTLMV